MTKKYFIEREAIEMSGIGRNNLMQIADKAGAVIRIGRKKLYDMEVLYDYLKNNPIQDGVKPREKA